MRFKELLNEKLSLSQFKEYAHLWDNLAKQIYRDIFEQYRQPWQKKPEVYRIYIPFETKESNYIKVPSDIEKHLKDKEITVTDYKTGKGKDKHNREVNLGKFLNDNPDIKKKFDNDKQRQAVSDNKYYVVISRHPYDIAGMSTNRGWSSCMNLEGGCNAHKVKDDIIYKSLVAYCIKQDDMNIEHPLGRLLIRAYRDNQGHVKFKEASNVYGTNVNGFITTVQDWIADVNPTVDGIFKAHSSLYYDTDDIRMFSDITNEKSWEEFKKNASQDDVNALVQSYFASFEVPYYILGNEIIFNGTYENISKEEFIDDIDWLTPLVKGVMNYEYQDEITDLIKRLTDIDKEKVLSILEEHGIDEKHYDYIVDIAIQYQFEEYNSDVLCYDVENILGYKEDLVDIGEDDLETEIHHCLSTVIPYSDILNTKFEEINNFYFWHSFVEEQKDRMLEDAEGIIKDYINNFRFDEDYVERVINEEY